MIYYIEVDYMCTLEDFKDIREARSEASEIFGKNNVTLVRKATMQDAEWHVAMGGKDFTGYFKTK